MLNNLYRHNVIQKTLIGSHRGFFFKFALWYCSSIFVMVAIDSLIQKHGWKLYVNIITRYIDRLNIQLRLSIRISGR